jgi:hypothetical protein
MLGSQCPTSDIIYGEKQIYCFKESINVLQPANTKNKVVKSAHSASSDVNVRTEVIHALNVIT